MSQPFASNHVAPRTIEHTRGDQFSLSLRRTGVDTARTPVDLTAVLITADLFAGEVRVQALTIDKTDPTQGRFAVRATEPQTAEWPRGYLHLRVAYDGPTPQDKDSTTPIPIRVY